LEQPLKITLPADGDPDAAATFAQAYEALTNDAQWTKQIYQHRLHDDFTDATSTLANRYTLANGGVGAQTVVDDSANGGFGALQQAAGTTLSDNSTASTTITSSVGTGNFRLRMMVRLSASNANTSAEYGFRASTANRITVVLFAGSLHWGVKVDSGTVVVSSSVIAGSTYQLLEILRLNGVLYVFANGTQIYTAADVANRNGCALYAFTQSATALIDYMDFR